jgi:hypothetical protein
MRGAGVWVVVALGACHAQDAAAPSSPQVEAAVAPPTVEVAPPPDAVAPDEWPDERVAVAPPRPTCRVSQTTERPEELPFHRQPIVVLSDDPAHCPPATPPSWGVSVTKGTRQCFTINGFRGEWVRVVIAPVASAVARRTPKYTLCNQVLEDVPPVRPHFMDGESEARAHFCVELAGLPSGKPLVVVNAPAPQRGSDEMAFLPVLVGRGEVVTLPLTKVHAGDVLPTRVLRSTGEPVAPMKVEREEDCDICRVRRNCLP